MVSLLYKERGTRKLRGRKRGGEGRAKGKSERWDDVILTV